MKARFVNEDFTYLKSKDPEELKKAAKADLDQEDYAKFGDTIDKLIDKGYLVSGLFKSDRGEYTISKIILHYYQIYEGNNGIIRALTPDNANVLMKTIEKYGYTDRPLRFELSGWNSYISLEEAKKLLKR